jgi:chemotaxis protein histidine kinase CheA
MTNYIGTPLQVDEQKFNNTVRQYSSLISKVNEVGRAYESLNPANKFTQDVFLDLVKKGIETIEKKYSEEIDQQIKAAKFTSKTLISTLKASTNDDLKELKTKISAMHEARNNAVSGLSEYPVELSNISIEDGQAVLTAESREKIKEIFTVRVNTEKQNNLHNAALELVAAYERVTSILTAEGYNMGFYVWGDLIGRQGRNLYFQEDDGKLYYNTELVALVDKK